ncbi:hypothetical protein [Goodfellowiella coeruleoviolacea]|uniref:hypothetical protein n=1 Tax=Goodfellowiella coeruleoviolacea TaxID=334858 RepID=UPI0020A4DB54|nr:hypothetical protein [Goodfellowiella coeruleoviolacea]
MAIPIVFTAAVAGVIVAGAWLVDMITRPGFHVVLSSSVFGAAAAVTIATSGRVSWGARWQRRWLRWSYPVAVLAVGLGIDGLSLPTAVAAGVGVPAVAALAVVCWRHRQAADSDTATEASPVERPVTAGPPVGGSAVEGSGAEGSGAEGSGAENPASGRAAAGNAAAPIAAGR